MSFMIFAFLLALSRGQRAGYFSESYRLLGVAYFCNGLRLACQLRPSSQLAPMLVVSDLFYLGFIICFWLGVRAYAQAHSLSWRLLPVPVALAVWVVVGRFAAIPFPWFAIPQHSTGALIFFLSGHHVWSLHRKHRNHDLSVMAIMMWIQGVSTATYPFTRTTWYAPYGFSLFALLASAIGMGLMVAALREEQRELLREITERKHSENLLRESEDRHRTILQAAIDGFIIVDKKGRLVEANDSYCRMSGYNQQELLGMPISTLEDVETTAETAARMKKIMDLGQDRFESRHRRKDGTVFDVEVSVQYRPSADGLFVAFVRDISKRKQDEEDRRKLEDQLLQSQKMESVGRLAGGVAHDFNNMLLVIIGHASLAMTKSDPSQAYYADLEQILKAGERSAGLTRQLLAFARKQTIAPKVLDLNATLEGMLVMLRRLLGENITLTWKPGKEVLPVKMDPSQIDQILANLCVNARDAIKGVGHISIETGSSFFDDGYRASHAEVLFNDYVRLDVSDDGCGIDKEILPHIFDPFFTTKSLGEGTGLGLSTVYGIVKQNQGFLQVYSESGMGTTFRLFLPRLIEEGAPAVRAEVAPPSEQGHETILLVEDEPAILSMTSQMLSGQGYQVLAARSPHEAIDLARSFTGGVHLLMTDMVMPEMNGKDLADAIVAFSPGIKVLFMSGYTADIIAHHGVLEEGVNFLDKPFSLPEVAAKVRDVLNQK